MDTVIQELAFSLENIGLPSHIIQKRIAELISFLGFQDLLHQSVHTLSGGQKQLFRVECERYSVYSARGANENE
ncbi:cobalt ABC transporter ATP-binding protein [Streptococcus pneumoniae]|nr:cobalt ABC transporter ATP-binding protein [Streptococcus pneumoniae]